MLNPRAIAIIQPDDSTTATQNCSQPLQTSGATPLSIMAERLDRIPEIQKVVLVTKKPNQTLVTAAHQAGWLVINRSNPYLAALRFLPLLLLADYLLCFDLRYPFIDPATCSELLAELNRTRLLRIKNGFEMAPRLIIQRYTLVKLKLLQYLNKNQAGLLEFAAKTLRPPEYRSDSVGLPRSAALLDARIVNQATLEQLGGSGLTKASLAKLESGSGFCWQTTLDTVRDYLCQMREASPTPHYWNTLLNHLESRFAITETKSFPLDVAINPTSVCNARCLFCNYPQHIKAGRHFLGLKEIQQMRWLKNLNNLGFGGGLGDPLVHPEFPAIFE
jgi:hypothetical protein